MLTIFILLLLAVSLYGGYRHGFIYQGILTAGFFGSMLIAGLTYRFLVPLIFLWVPYPSATQDSKFVFFSSTIGLDLDQSFYAAIAFIIILAFCYLLFRIFARSLSQYQFVTLSQNYDQIGAVLLQLVIFLAVASLLIFILGMIPLDGIQNAIEHSFLAKFLGRYTPFFSWLYQKLFISII